MAFDFKKMVADDRRLVFLNLAEFGEEHKVDGKTITVVLDDNALKRTPRGARAGRGRVVPHAVCSSRGSAARRPAGEGLNIDGREYIVNDWSEDMGVATIALGQTVTM